jgi:hypothetical protein
MVIFFSFGVHPRVLTGLSRGRVEIVATVFEAFERQRGEDGAGVLSWGSMRHSTVGSLDEKSLLT